MEPEKSKKNGEKVLKLVQKMWEFSRNPEDRYIVWWASQQDCETIGDKLPRSFPAYLQAEYKSRYGCNGSGRLWVPVEFGEMSIDPWKDTDLAKKLGDDYGGIVIEEADIQFVIDLPGIITDMELNRAWVDGGLVITEKDVREARAAAEEGRENPLPQDQARNIIENTVRQLIKRREDGKKSLGKLPKNEEELKDYVDEVIRTRELNLKRHREKKPPVDTADVYLICNMVTIDEGKIRTYFSTNDEDEDGVPDGYIETWEVVFPNIVSAVNHCGITRIDDNGQKVKVTLDGEQLTQEALDKIQKEGNYEVP